MPVGQQIRRIFLEQSQNRYKTRNWINVEKQSQLR